MRPLWSAPPLDHALTLRSLIGGGGASNTGRLAGQDRRPNRFQRPCGPPRRLPANSSFSRTQYARICPRECPLYDRPWRGEFWFLPPNPTFVHIIAKVPGASDFSMRVVHDACPVCRVHVAMTTVGVQGGCLVCWVCRRVFHIACCRGVLTEGTPPADLV